MYWTYRVIPQSQSPMYRSVLILLIVFIQLCCTQQKQAKIVICVDEDKLSYELMDTSKFICSSRYLHLSDWWRYEISENGLLYFRGSDNGTLLYSKTLNTIYYYQSFSIFNHEVNFFDTSFYFKKGTSIFFNSLMKESGTLNHIKTLESLIGKVYKVPSIDLLLEDWHHSIIPYIEKSMKQKGLPASFISNAVDIIEQEMTSAFTNAKDIYVNTPHSSYCDASKEYIRIYVFRETTNYDNPFIFYELEI